MNRYYLEIHEGGFRIPIGTLAGYETLEEAEKTAEKYVDDALPRNIVYVVKAIGYAALAGDGSTYYKKL